MKAETESPTRYSIILTNRVPASPYELQEKFMLRAVKPTDAMFEEFSYGVPHGFPVVMALPYYGYDTYDDTYRTSYEFHRDIAMFHSFVTDEPEVFTYAVERGIKEIYPVSELSFMDSPNVVLDNERRVLHVKECDFGFSDEEHVSPVEISDEAPCYGNRVDFNQFPMVIPNPDGEYDFEYSEINYRDAFRLFRQAKESEEKRKLYNQICSYVFIRSIWHISNVRLLYCNDDLSIVFCVAILESIFGDPPKCDEKIKCRKCGKLVPDHYSVSWQQYLNNKLSDFGCGYKKYVDIILNLRRRRHMFSHKANYFDLSQELWKVHHKRNIQDEVPSPVGIKHEEELYSREEDTDTFVRIVGKVLAKSFLKQYGK